jgi:trans-aconitate 3-methyltransferase
VLQNPNSKTTSISSGLVREIWLSCCGCAIKLYNLFAGDYHDSISDPRPVLIRKSVSWEGLQAYLRTFSSLYTFFENNPSDAAQRTDLAQRPSGGKGGDVVERIWWTLKEEVAKVNEGQPGEEVVMEWPLAMLLCKKT